MSWKSDFPELSGAEFSSANDALQAEEHVLKQRETQKKIQERTQAESSINRFNQKQSQFTLSDAADKRLGKLGQTPPEMKMSGGKEIPVARGFTVDQEQAEAIKGTADYEQRMGGRPDDMELAKREGLYSNPSEPATEMVQNLQDEKTLESTGGFGKSSVGAALAFTIAHPELVAEAKDTVAMMRKSDKNYDPILLKSIEDQAQTDIRAAQQRLSQELFKPETARITERAKRPEVVQTAEEKSSATERGRMNEKYALASQGRYDISMTEATKVANSVQAINAMNRLANMIEDGSLTLKDVTPAGVFTNPQAKLDNEIAQEMYARPISGAAINAGEWTKFKGELGTNVWNLATEDGRKAAAARLRDIIRSNKQAVALALKDDQWFDRINKIGRDDTTKTTTGGSWSDDKEKRYQELLDKQREGILR